MTQNPPVTTTPQPDQPTWHTPLQWHENEPVGPLIRRVRTWRGKSQYAVADALCELSGNTGISRLHMNRWENGKRIPQPYWRQYLSKALDIPLDVLDRAAAVSAANRTQPPNKMATPASTAADLHLTATIRPGCHQITIHLTTPPHP